MVPESSNDTKSAPAFRLGERVRVADRLNWRPGVAGKIGKISRPQRPISWPSYFRTETTEAGVRRIYWVEFEQPAAPGAVESAEVDENDLSSA